MGAHAEPGPHITGQPTTTGDRTGSWVLDRYQLRRELHAGATGELWLARERDSRELVVARLGLGPVRSERARREGDVLVRLLHGGIPRLVEQGAIDGGWCVIAEHVEGAPLAKVLSVTNPSPPRAVGWARQVALAVAQLHTAGVVHGDLHPGNVIIGRDDAGRDRMVLVGFGVATLDGVAPSRPGPVPHTAAPELVRGEPATPASDVYAIGAILYRMLVERWPFTGTEDDVRDAQIATPPPPLGRHAPSLRLPPGLEALVFRCLDKDPSARVSSAEELAVALGAVEFLPQRDWVRVEGSIAPAAPRERPASSERGGVGWWAWFAGLAVVLIMALGWWLLG
ncbi:MAG: serine/threonine-protein kinase [Myxococcota bacterium]